MASATDLPTVPPGWERAPERLIRFAAPDGESCAWLAPDFGANCVGYAVRRRGRWVQILHAAGPVALTAAPIRYGCPLLFPFPGHVRLARYRWAGVDHTLPSNVTERQHYVHGFAARHSWRVTHRARDGVVAEFSTLRDLPGGRRAAGYPFAIGLRLLVRLTNEALAVTLQATNEGQRAAPVGLGLHPHFALGALGGDRAAVRVFLPGEQEHILAEAIPTGEKRAVADPEVLLPPRGQRMLVARTSLGPLPLAMLAGPPGTLDIRLTAVEGCRDLLLFVPPLEPSISLEPHSCAPGAASQPEGHPDGLVALDPGATRRLAITVAVGEA